ncbi:MAG TPA: HEAT repeat domain-containing protein [Pirellula sp.]|nr:HEAT repeat domain-containing protein [Pirellula sp.]
MNEALKMMARCKNRRWSFALMGAVIISFLLFYSNGKPRYLGKTVSEWLALYDQGVDNPGYKKASEAMVAIGKNAVPFLIERLRTQDSVFTKIPFINSLPLINARSQKNLRMSQLAALALADIGPAASNAIPDLCVATNHLDFWVSAHAAAALIRIRQEEVLPIIQSLKRTNPNTRFESWNKTAYTIGVLGPYAAEAVPVFTNEHSNSGPLPGRSRSRPTLVCGLGSRMFWRKGICGIKRGDSLPERYRFIYS